MAILVVVVAVLGCRGRKVEEPSSAFQRSVSFDVSGFGKYAPSIEFSQTGDAICLDWGFDSGDGAHNRLVISVDGHVLPGALDQSGQFTDEFRAQFPKTLPRVAGSTTSLLFHQERDAVTLFPYPDFVADAEEWILNDDLTRGFRVLYPTKEGMRDGRSRVSNSEEPRQAEFWQLHPRPRRLWQVILPREVCSIGDGNLFTINDRAFLMVAHNCRNALILSAEDGQIVSDIDYNDYMVDIRHLIRGDTPERFSAGEVSFAPQKALLACGGSDGTQFIVLSFADVDNIRRVYDSMQCLAPVGRRGIWSVQRVEFCAQGKLLVMEYIFSGRGTSIVEYRTEVYETDGWQQVWSMQSRSARSLAVSPNGKDAAMIVTKRGRIAVEIGTLPSLPTVSSGLERHPSCTNKMPTEKLDN